MNRRDFITSIIGASAVIALAKVVGAQPVAVEPIPSGTKLIDMFPNGMTATSFPNGAWHVDESCPPDRIYAIDLKAFFGNPPYKQPNPRAAAMLRLK